jgi:uncharacterized protein YcfL
MRKLLLPAVLTLVVCGCHEPVKVPTAQELITDRQLLAEWQMKCNTGEYSHLPASDKANLCSTTNDASFSVAQIESGKKDSDFFGNMSKRK